MLKYVVLLFLIACSSPTGQPEREQRVAAALWEGWSRAVELYGIPELVEERVLSDRFQIQFPDIMGYDKLCYPSTTARSVGCFRWLLMKHKYQNLYSLQYPAAIISPVWIEKEGQAPVERLALHEITHGAVDRMMRRARSDPYDYKHSDFRIWANKMMPSAESFGQEALGGVALSQSTQALIRASCPRGHDLELPSMVE